MAQTGLILVPLVLLSIATFGQCVSPTTCRDAADVKKTPNGQSASSPNWETDQESVVMTVEYEPRAERCFTRCHSVCKGWTGCVAFSSWISQSYSGQCYCYGWDRLPNFVSYNDDYRSGWCVTGWFETDTLK